MPTIDEASRAKTQLGSVLEAGNLQISDQQEIVFTLYVRVDLPVDGTRFWVLADLVSPAALFNAAAFNTTTFGSAGGPQFPSTTLTVKGSLHYTSSRTQDESENYAVNKVIFTAEEPVEPFNKIGPSTLWIGTYKDLTFAFGSHGSLYQAAGLWHYEGFAVYPDMQPQIIDKLSDLSTKQIVSNSLPLWLKMNNYTPAVYEAFGNSIPLYSSFLLPANIPPPWISVHVLPESTEALGSAPALDSAYGHTQLTKETVRLTLFGLTNQQAMDFVDFVQQFVANQQLFGVMNAPIMRDDKRVQTELGAIAKKKTITYDVNYYQTQARDIARELIVSVIPEFILN